MRHWKAAILGCFSVITAWASSTAVHQMTLSNGLNVLIKEDHRAPVVLMSVWYRVGGSFEPDGITGISHVLEHMMFRGTTTHPAGELEAIVSRLGGEQNAMTEDDQTVYYEEVATTNLPMILALEADRMRHLTLSAADFSKEIQVVMEERRMRVDDDPQGRLWERFLAAAYVNSPYHHQTIGWAPDLHSLTIEDVRNWYHAWYTPNNAFLVIVGDVDVAAVMAQVQRTFGVLGMHPLPVVKPRTEIPSLGPKRVEVDIPSGLSWLVMGFPVPSLAETAMAKEVYALTVLSAILSEGNSARLVHDLIREQGIATDADTYYNSMSRYATQFILMATPATGHTLNELHTALWKEIQILQTTLVTREELERVKAQVLAEKVYAKDSLMEQALELGTPFSVGLPFEVGETYADRIQAVTALDVQAVAQKYLRADRITEGILNPKHTTKQQNNRAGSYSSGLSFKPHGHRGVPS
ncbi:MAG: hypothetical protein A3J38_10500 [Gammaproteobacteria bacterium RIFCSPHIGHO2_12_FULL_45_9]|nr:MAG: hypothetical protein A3J38_10500 [Gammaproteobacteria bacterium RIFCSPHIGHO2_12_FULL_45_9]